jgi:hypothetical protein
MESLSYKSYDLIPLSNIEEVTEIIEDNVFENNLDIAKEVICAICQNLVNFPTSCSVCQNLFCKKCIDQWMKNNFKCPMRCNQTSSLKLQDIPKTTRNLINKIKLKCLKFSEGCSEPILYENFFSHLRTCEYIKFKCEYCQYKGNYDSCKEHSIKCQDSFKECKACKGRHKKKQFDLLHNKDQCIRETSIVLCFNFLCS